jgi:hypothetical protein
VSAHDLVCRGKCRPLVALMAPSVYKLNVLSRCVSWPRTPGGTDVISCEVSVQLSTACWDVGRGVFFLRSAVCVCDVQTFGER